MRAILCCCLLFAGGFLNAQKKPLTISDIGQWPTVSGALISGDGRFVLYYVDSLPTSRLALVTSGGKALMMVPGGGQGQFSPDSRWMICLVPGDSMLIYDLKYKAVSYMRGITSWKMSGAGSRQYMIFTRKAGDSFQLFIRNMATGSEELIAGVTRFFLSNNGASLVFEQQDVNKHTRLSWYDLAREKSIFIWSGAQKITSLCFDREGSRLAFLSHDETDGGNRLWYSTIAHPKAVLRLDGDVLDDDPPRFTNNNKWILIGLKKKKDTDWTESDNAHAHSKLRIWSYRDRLLASEVAISHRFKSSYRAVVSTDGDSYRQLDTDSTFMVNFSEGISGDYAIIQSRNNGSEVFWNPRSRVRCYTVHLPTGRRQLLCKDKEQISAYLSPNGKYAVYYDFRSGQYYVMNNVTGANHVLSKDIPSPMYDTTYDLPSPAPPSGIGAWSPDGESVFLYDQFDIWSADLSGKRAPVCLTKLYGRQHHIVFRIAGPPDTQQILLTAFDRKAKDNGFYLLRQHSRMPPEKLTMGPYVYGEIPGAVPANPPLKAAYAAVYVVKRSGVSQAPDFFSTTDFKHFTQLSNLQPQQAFNWMSAELIHYRLPDSTLCEGLVYKPADFDSSRKYPVIVHFYERLADGLNRYIEPRYTGGSINIAWFVSNGYVVLCPDIYYKTGYPGASALASVKAAIHKMSGYPWFDTTRMGIQGHSFGGYEANYILTATPMFRAACTSAGMSDFVSSYGNVTVNGQSNNAFYESHQGRIGATPWQRPELYIKNSPIYQADKITTPLLLVNNNKDPLVLFDQGLTLFTALRRLGRKVWMFDYENGSHGVIGEDAKDFTIRLTAFFDYYLKGAAPPRWMISPEDE